MELIALDLMPRNTLGYYFQLSLLSLTGIKDVKESIALDKVKFRDLLITATEKAFALKLGKHISLTSQAFCKDLDVLCGVEAPRLLYLPQDRRIITSEAGLHSVCGRNVSELGRAFMCGTILSLIEAAIAGQVPLARQARLPMLFRATLFGKTRGPRVLEVEDVKVSAESLGLSLIGAFASFLGRARIRDSSYEYFLVPDGSSLSLEFFSRVLEILGGEFVKVPQVPSIPEISRTLATEGGVSIDTSTYMATLIRASLATERYADILSLASRKAFESLILLRIETSGNRPQIVWAGPLTISGLLLTVIGEKKLDRVIRRVYELTVSASRVREERIRNALRDASRTCMNSLALVLLTTSTGAGRLELLKNCARSLAVLLDERRVPEEIRERVVEVLESIE